MEHLYSSSVRSGFQGYEPTDKGAYDTCSCAETCTQRTLGTLRWMMDNISVRTDSAGNVKMDKSKLVEKIDGAVAMVMALNRAIRNGGQTESIYDSRGLIFI